MYNVIIYNKDSTNADVPTVIHSRYERISDCKRTGEKNATATLTFTIYPGNPGYDYLREFATTVRVVRLSDAETVFEGRVLQAVQSMDESGLVCQNVTCEGITGGMCCYLHDTTVGFKDEQTWEDTETMTGLQVFIKYLLDNHNAKVPAEKQVFMGDVTVKTNVTNEQVTKGLNFESTYECLSSKIVDVFGGEMAVRRADDGLLYLDYKEKLGATKAQPIRVGLNMRSGSITPKFDSIITRLYPRGAKLTEVTETDDDGNATATTETEARLSIAEVNAGREYIDDQEGIVNYGIIEGTHEWDDVTEPLNLLNKAEEWLAENNEIPVTAAVTAYDLSALGLDYDAFGLLDWYPCRNDLIGLDQTLEVIKMTLDVSNPDASTIEFGEYRVTQTHKITTVGKLVEDVRYLKSQAKTTIHNLETYTRETRTMVELGDEQVLISATEKINDVDTKYSEILVGVNGIFDTVEDYEKRQNSKFSQMSDQISLKVTKGDVSSQISVESGAVKITSNRFSWESTYSSLTSNGTLTCTNATLRGTFTCGSDDSYKTTLNSAGQMLGYYNGTNWGWIDFSATSTDEGTGATQHGLQLYGIEIIRVTTPKFAMASSSSLSTTAIYGYNGSWNAVSSITDNGDGTISWTTTEHKFVNGINTA